MWTEEFPIEEGHYWFYGLYFRETEPSLQIIKKWGKFLIRGGNFISDNDLRGVFLRIEEPELPGNWGVKLP